MRIGISYGPQQQPYPRYHDAIREAAARLSVDVETIDLWENPAAIDDVDVMVFTGGPDIAPERYGKPEGSEKCEGVDRRRDEHEFRLYERAGQRELPVLGICRGAQLINVARGGTLVPDIATRGAHTKNDGVDARHDVVVENPRSLVGELARGARARVNSSHHQAVDRLATPFVVTARSADDGVIEAYEWAEPQRKPFLLAVQWHPERMDQPEALAGAVFECFLRAAAKAASGIGAKAAAC